MRTQKKKNQTKKKKKKKKQVNWTSPKFKTFVQKGHYQEGRDNP